MLMLIICLSIIPRKCPTLLTRAKCMVRNLSTDAIFVNETTVDSLSYFKR